MSVSLILLCLGRYVAYYEAAGQLGTWAPGQNTGKGPLQNTQVPGYLVVKKMKMGFYTQVGPPSAGCTIVRSVLQMPRCYTRYYHAVEVYV